MSGGVDSSVAAGILAREGCDVVGITIKTYRYEDVGGNIGNESSCCSLDGINDARAVAALFGFPHYVLDFSERFGIEVIEKFEQEYLAGRTPNPCVRCNQFVKFEALLRKALALDAQHGAALPTMLSTMHIYPLNGAAQRVRKGDTAFSFRDANFIQMIAAVHPDAANDDRMIAWARDFWKALHPHSAGAGYVNMSMDEGQAQVRAFYRDNYQRLVDLKKKYDPTNLFRVNQNIKPE